MLEIIFATRNKAYGAYQLRTAYPTYLLRALVFTLFFIGGLGLIPRFTKAIAAILPTNDPYDCWKYMPTIELETPPPVPPPPVTTPPPPPRATVRFVPPLITDRETDEPQEPTSVDEILDNDAPVGNQTVDGPVDGPPDTGGDPDIGLVEPVKRPQEPDEIMDPITVSKMPSFPGGEIALMEFLQKNIQYPSFARESNIMGTVAVQFIVGKDGRISDLIVLKDIGGGCGKEAVRVIHDMPQWIPGEANGVPVKVRFTMPVRFKLI